MAEKKCLFQLNRHHQVANPPPWLKQRHDRDLLAIPACDPLLSGNIILSKLCVAFLHIMELKHFAPKIVESSYMKKLPSEKISFVQVISKIRTSKRNLAP